MKVKVAREATHEELKELYREQVCKMQDLEAGLKAATDNVGKLAAELQRVTEERDSYRGRLETAARANDSLMEEIKQLKAQATEAHGQFEKRIKELGDGLDASTALLKTAQDDVDIRNKKIEELRKRCQRAEEGAASAVRAQEALLDQQRADCERALNERDVARREADYLRKRAQEAEERAVQLQEQIKVHEEVVERIREQNSRFVEEQREAKKQCNLKAMELASTKDDITRLVRLLDDFKDRLAAVTKEKNQIVEISNGFARERDEIQADYDARGRVIKKLRKRLHKLKKKLKH